MTFIIIIIVIFFFLLRIRSLYSTPLKKHNKNQLTLVYCKVTRED